jgi:hypothetical protein
MGLPSGKRDQDRQAAETVCLNLLVFVKPGSPGLFYLPIKLNLALENSKGKHSDNKPTLHYKNSI